MVKNIGSSCYIAKFDMVVFGVDLKEEYWNKNFNKLLVFDTVKEKLISNLIY
jgi:hypothetical protein